MTSHDSRLVLFLILPLCALLLFSGCESQILPSVMSEAVNNALPTYLLTVETEGTGDVNILEPIEVKKGEMTSILATAGNNYVWSHWYVVAGSASFGDPNNRSTKIALQNGNTTICAVFVPDEYLRLSSPVGGESYLIDGPEIEIQWESLNITGNVDIYLCDEIGTTIDFIGSTSVTTGSYSWDVAGENPSPGAYRIKILLSGNPAFTDISDDVFYLTNLSVDSPTGGAYGAGGSCPISWSTDASSGTVRIELMSGSTSTIAATIAEGVSIAGGSYSWTIGGSLSGSYSIRLVREDLESIKAQGGAFTIINGITISSPSNVDKIAGSSLPISWSSPSGGSVKVELLESGSVSTIISSSTSNDGTYTYTLPLTQLPDTAYAVRVTTLTSPAFSDTSSSFRILPPTPTGVDASDDSDELTAYVAVSWNLVSGNPSYRIYRATSATGTYAYLNTVSGTTNYNDTAATPGTLYYYKISALRNGVEGNLSAWNDGVRDIVAPSLTTSSNPSYAKLTWNDVIGETGYRIYRSTSSGSGYLQIGTDSASPYYDNSADPGQRYYYKVAAYNPNTGESLSNSVEGHRDLAKVTGLTTVSHEGYHVLSWSSVSGAVSGYRIYRKEYSETNGSWGSWTAMTTTGATSRNMYPSIIGKVYAYAVAAYNSVTGEYLWSDTVYGHAKLSPPMDFTAVSAGSSANVLSWYGEAAATGGYEIQAYAPATSWQTQTTAPQGTYSYTDTFKSITTFTIPIYYRIRCVYDAYWDDYDGSLVIYNTTSDWEGIEAP